MLTEAIAVKIAKEDREQQKNQERKDWRKDKDGLNKLREIAAGVS